MWEKCFTDGYSFKFTFFPGGPSLDVYAYIQANHFLPDNVVDIFWGDYSITCAQHDGRWRVQREEIVGTSFLKFHGEPIS